MPSSKYHGGKPQDRTYLSTCGRANARRPKSQDQTDRKEPMIMTELHTGDPAPQFTAPDQDGNTVRLADFQGRKCFIFFYPKANTGG